MTLLAGTAYLTVDSQQLMLAGQAKYTPHGVERTSLMSQQGYAGYSETRKPGRISMQVRDDGSLSLAALQGKTGISVFLHLANGKHVSGKDMQATDVFELDTTEATFEVVFEGPTVEEVS